MTHSQVRAKVVPHTTNQATLKAQKEVYDRHQTPVVSPEGRVTGVPLAPGGPDLAARHLGEISRSYGAAGVAQTVQGLAATRGWSFVSAAVQRAPVAAQGVGSQVLYANGGSEPLSDRPVFGAPAARIQASQATHGLPQPLLARMPSPARDYLRSVRVHDDAHAHAAASAVGARAFTVGSSIYMGAGEHRPTTESGQKLLSHEAAHALQQRGATVPSTSELRISAPNSAEEAGADRYAEAVMAGKDPGEVRPATPGVARLMRAISFTHGNHVFSTVNPGVAENAAAGTFQIAGGAPSAPHFNWTSDVTIHGNAGDPFANFQVGPLQVLRNWWFNVWWGTGANRTHRKGTVATPIRDALTSAHTWYIDGLASANFAADGDVRSTGLNDTPGIRGIPLANPIAGRVSTRGWFNYGVTFVSYLSARDTTAAAGAGFRHLANVYWNMSIDGNFDTTRAAGSQVSVTSAATNRSGVIQGISTDFPPILGGAVPNESATITDT